MSGMHSFLELRMPGATVLYRVPATPSMFKFIMAGWPRSRARVRQPPRGTGQPVLSGPRGDVVRHPASGSLDGSDTHVHASC